MKLKLLIYGLLTFFSITTFAKQIDENTARIVGQNFLITKPNSSASFRTAKFQMVYKSNSSNHNSQTTFFYIFNISTNGFVIVAGDDTVTPILGYSTEGNFDPNNIPQNITKWFGGYKNEIRSIVEQNILASTDIQTKWNKLKNGGSINTTSNTASKIMLGVAPLIQTKWNQFPYYNALCPIDRQTNQQTVTGCVATAMAQIMKYWNYPATGSGYHSYNHPQYGTLSANYGNITYQWSSMPNSVTSSNSAVATLMYHCGVSVDMNYNIASVGGSSAQTLDVAKALKTYFNYSTSTQGLYRSAYNDSQWTNLLKVELDASRPIQYAGTGDGGGHSFVCDGYDSNNYFHFNWGWGGNSDGYFQISALNPGSLGAGGGSGGFNSNQRAIIGIQPPSSAITYNMALYNNVTPSLTTIGYGNAFTVTTNIANNGTNTFSGDYTIGVFDSNNNFVDYVETKLNYGNLQGGYAYTNNIVFSNSGLFTMLPGNYTLGLYYRTTGGNWKIVQNSGSFTNFTSITVVNPNPLKLNSSIVVSPSTTLIQGQSTSVNLNILNSGTSTFIGQYKVGLYNLDGTFVQDIEALNEVNGLPIGYTYGSPFLTFSTSSITANPGSYLMAVQHKTTTGSWELTGSTSTFLNPVNVTVIKAPYLADAYEINDAFAQSYSLPISFSTNNASVKTTGSNAHIGTDNDFYKIVLPSGFNYTITPRLQDSFSSNDGNTYSLDALFSYSTDGITWSEAFDDVMTGNITKNNGGTIYFKTAPYFQGNTGTYLLDVNLSRTVALGIDENQFSNNIKVFPNPTTSKVIFDNSNYNFGNVSVVNSLGQEVSKIKFTTFSNNQELDLNGLSAGVYILKFSNNETIKTIKVIKE